MIKRLLSWIWENWEKVSAIVGTIVAIGSAIVAIVHQTPKYKYAKARKKYLKKIDVVHNLFQRGKDSKIIYDINRHADVLQLLQELEKPIQQMNSCYLEYSKEVVYDFFDAHQAFIEEWYEALRPPKWYKWYDDTKGPPHQNNTLNWNAFDHTKFSGEFESLSGKLNNLRNQVRDSIPRTELNSISSEESTE